MPSSTNLNTFHRLETYDCFSFSQTCNCYTNVEVSSKNKDLSLRIKPWSSRVFITPYFFCSSTNKTKQIYEGKKSQADKEIKLSSSTHPTLIFLNFNHSCRNKIVYAGVISFLLTHVSIWKEKINFMISGKSLGDLEKANKRKLRTQATKQSSAIAHWILCLGNVNEPQILPIIRWGNCLYFQTDDAAIMKRLTGNLRVSTVVIWFLL